MNGFDNHFAKVSELISTTILNKTKWKWGKNSRCKYIELRIDTRSGECQIKDRDGELISLEQLMYQYELTDEHMEKMYK